MNHEFLMDITVGMPMKTINVNGEPYLERYFVCETADGTQLWLHRFLRNDSERHLHAHPWKARSRMLCGWYHEEREYGVTFRNMTDDEIYITPDRLHRISAVEPNTWTLMVVEPERLPQWYFVNDQGEREYMETSPRDWYNDCQPRAAA